MQQLASSESSGRHRIKVTRNGGVAVKQVVGADPEIAQMVGFIHGNIKTVTVTMFRVSKKRGRRLNVLNTDKS